MAGDSMRAALTGGLAAAIAVPLVVGLFRRLLPAKVAPQSGVAPSPNEKRFKRLNTLYGFGLIIMASIYTPVLWLGLSQGALAIRRTIPPTDVALYLPSAYWGLVALFLAICLSGLTTLFFLKSRLGRDYQEFMAFSDRKEGYQSRLVLQLVMWPTAILCGLSTIKGLRCRIVLSGDRLTVQRLLSLEPTTYPFPNITSIMTAPSLVAPNGKIVYRQIAVIHFKDGTSWTTDAAGGGQDAANFVHLVSMKSGVSIQPMAVLSRSEL